ncbi:hypothetical protein G6O69_39125 [Pseudenhygromyxa sp. WMMC2535]|uniref:MopE-related protein n=1 Tax=Pseudenhygromyxa sp. WMMC2535 TaxID=2712867 RepID=UPI001595D707|nr:MopE-related protein [Pseudenhygromyxa sp. WMMC2535]NVB43872.1 hypothetical protein [Pseudenhygromyxa sp. WMMC2535]
MSARTLVTLTGPTLTFALTLAACGPRYETTEDSNGDALTVGDSADLGDDDDTGGVCENDADCADNPAGPVCDEAVGLCFPECEPGDVDDCYEGPAGTEGVGICTAGTWTCAQDGTWGACVGAVEPSAEICGNDIDEDCDGSLADADADGDGWGACSGDCCDDELLGCVDAHLVNPGAFEVAGNGVDDDCDGEIDEPTTACDAGLSSNSGDGLDYAAALDLCETTTENAPLAERRWGVISAELTLADGSSAPLSVQHAIRPAFGDNIVPSGGDRMVVLSSGNAAAPGSKTPATRSSRAARTWAPPCPRRRTGSPRTAASSRPAATASTPPPTPTPTTR